MIEVLKRTFEASEHPADSVARLIANRDVLTSQYMTSHRYMVRWLAFMTDGTPSTAQKYFTSTFRTKGEAEAYALTVKENPHG